MLLFTPPAARLREFGSFLVMVFDFFGRLFLANRPWRFIERPCGHPNLEGFSRRNALRFYAVVGPPGGKLLVFLGAAARPLDDGALDLVLLADAEGDGQLRLREVA